MDDTATLADFLRSARARLTPEEIGLPVNRNAAARRVPGLRRDEVAGLAGVSVDYYARMEQGRVTQASDAFVNALAEVLQLNEAERNYLFSLLSASTGGRTQQRPRASTVRASVHTIMDSLSAQPAFVLGVGMDVLAMNDLAKLLMKDFTRAAGLGRSLARWTFLDPAARTLFVDWDIVACDVAAMLRHDARSHPNDDALNELIGELSVKSDAFRAWWSQHRVWECTFGLKRFEHPLVGRIDVNYETFPVPGEPDQQLFVYSTQPGSPSSDALRILASWRADEAAALEH
ncbi:helix-turn-helix transcriptional regulator [Cryobacterium psychrophilum]|uniref:XRE family transcriptional regulator n=1 Tax=Cryobacterium psychrophilum TaxID=41988 RepID=A0A4Y8KS86_9MICO|nr:helix-turn-helix transcriptional regulator [Cryobacterium psychrophilum]TDW28815.1 helix-turn-helix protein [Cryobacterium psychrophilum]TFD82458.1 XRE family transcriptional regulator [Cryobacterium psychrophilum]